MSGSLPQLNETLPEGGYCFNCKVAFPTEREGDVHYAMTGHEIGWPLEDVQWPTATEAQVMGR